MMWMRIDEVMRMRMTKSEDFDGVKMGGRYDWFGLVTGLQDGEYKGMNEVMIEGPKGKERKNGRERKN